MPPGLSFGRLARARIGPAEGPKRSNLRGDRLAEWIATVERDELPKLHSFAAGLNRDLAAVVNGLTLAIHLWGGGGHREPDQDAQAPDVRAGEVRPTPRTRPPGWIMRPDRRGQSSSARFHWNSSATHGRVSRWRHAPAAVRRRFAPPGWLEPSGLYPSADDGAPAATRRSRLLDAVWFLTDRGVIRQERPAPAQPGGGHQANAALYPIVQCDSATTRPPVMASGWP
jgi:hypothetical protein